MLYCCFEASAQSSIQVQGRVTASDSTSGIPYAHIYDMEGQYVFVSDSLGYFNIQIPKKDRLVFSSVGFTPYIMSADRLNDSLPLLICLQPQVYQLDSFTFKKFRISKEQHQDYQDFINKPAAPALQSPISFLYDTFSKRAKEQKKFREIYLRMEMAKQAKARYSIQLVQTLTGLDHKEAERFKEFCKLSNQFVVRASDYELGAAIRKCYKKYTPKPKE